MLCLELRGLNLNLDHQSEILRFCRNHDMGKPQSSSLICSKHVEMTNSLHGESKVVEAGLTFSRISLKKLFNYAFY